LAVLAGWITALAGQTAEAERWAAIADAASFDLVPVDGSASFDSARAMLRAMMAPAGPQQALADASFAMAQEPSWSPWRGTALCLCAEAHLLIGDVDRAGVLFAESSTLAAVMSNTDNFVDSESELALLAMDGGRWASAAEHVEGALDAIEAHRMQDYAACLLAFAAAARLAVHRGDSTEADRHLAQAMRARPTSTFVLPYLAVRLRLQLARGYRAKGDATAARHLLKEIDDVLSHRPDLGALVDEVDEFRQILTSSARAGSAGGAPLPPPSFACSRTCRHT
jgi:LuxR family maltose regulon positive regulatory protein